MSDSRSHVEFPTTSWTLICRAQDVAGEEYFELLNELLRRYWKPIYSLYRANGLRKHDAEELVQEFLQGFVEGKKILKFERRESRFRSWLRTCAKNFLRDTARRRRASPEGRSVSFADLQKSSSVAYEPTGEDPDEAFAEGWRRELLDHAMNRLATRCDDCGRTEDFDVFCAYYCAQEDARTTWKRIAERFELPDWKVAARKADWVKDQLARAIRDEVRSYVDSDAEIDDELRRLL